MNTMERRATEYARIAQNCEKCGEDDCLLENFRCDHFRRVYYAFLNGAKEQNKIDINKAWQWIENNLFPPYANNIDMWEDMFRESMDA